MGPAHTSLENTSEGAMEQESSKPNTYQRHTFTTYGSKVALHIEISVSCAEMVKTLKPYECQKREEYSEKRRCTHDLHIKKL